MSSCKRYPSDLFFETSGIGSTDPRRLFARLLIVSARSHDNWLEVLAAYLHNNSALDHFPELDSSSSGHQEEIGLLERWQDFWSIPVAFKIRILHMLVNSALLEDEELLGVINSGADVLENAINSSKKTSKKSGANGPPKEQADAERRIRGHPGTRFGEDAEGDVYWLFRGFRLDRVSTRPHPSGWAVLQFRFHLFFVFVASRSCSGGHRIIDCVSGLSTTCWVLRRSAAGSLRRDECLRDIHYSSASAPHPPVPLPCPLSLSHTHTRFLR